MHYQPLQLFMRIFLAILVLMRESGHVTYLYYIHNVQRSTTLSDQQNIKCWTCIPWDRKPPISKELSPRWRTIANLTHKLVNEIPKCKMLPKISSLLTKFHVSRYIGLHHFWPLLITFDNCITIFINSSNHVFSIVTFTQWLFYMFLWTVISDGN